MCALVASSMAGLLPSQGYNYLPPHHGGEEEKSLPINQVQEQVRTIEVPVPTPYEVEKVVFRDVPVPQVRFSMRKTPIY